MPLPSQYYDKDAVATTIEKGRHREAVGGLWDEMGRLQLEFLTGQGLSPEMTLLDIGCGCLRGGVHFIDYLQTGHYYGQDINEEYLQAGYEIELNQAGLQEKCPRKQLFSSDDFDFSALPVSVDMALAQSLFTHLPLNHIRLCLSRLSGHLKPGGKLYATFFPCEDRSQLFSSITQPGGGIVTTHTADPYHYLVEDMRYAAEGLPYEIHYIGAWGHPRGQHMVCYKRI